MSKKYVHSAAEITNDRSLKFNGYKHGEAVYCDTMNNVRFGGYVKDGIQLLDMVMRPLPTIVPILSVRRHGM